MPRWVIAALGAGVAVGIAVLVWQLRAAPERPKRGAAAADAQPKSRQTAPEAAPGRLTPAEIAADPGDGGEEPRRKTEDEVSVQYIEKLLSRTVPNQVMRAVAGCYNGEAGDSETRMTVEFTVVFDEDIASLRDVTITEPIGHASLEACAVDVLGALTWRQPRAPNMERKESVEISINDLVKRHKQLMRDDD